MRAARLRIDGAGRETVVAMECLSGPVTASPPSAVTSSVPSCVLACPQGDISDTVIVRGIEGAPRPGYQVVMDFSQCTGITLCSAQLSPPYVVLSPTQIAVTIASDGSAIFALQVRARAPVVSASSRAASS